MRYSLMQSSSMKTGAFGLMAAFLMLGSYGASAETSLTNKIDEALGKKDLGALQSLLKQSPTNVDEVVKGLLRTTQSKVVTDPDFSGKMMTLAGEYAPQITPPTVPAVCADLRRIVEAVPENQLASPLFTTIVKVSQSFASAPVVVSAGRPNLCQEAWLQAANASGDPLLFQNPGMRSPGLPPVTIGPGIPPGGPIPEDKPSAD